jgi:hypothetical protein
MMGVEARLARVLGPQRARQVRELATMLEGGDASVIEAFGRSPHVATSAPSRPVVEVRIAAADLKAAGGRKVVRETVAACVWRDTPDIAQAAAEAVLALKGVAPQDTVEGMVAMQMIGIHSAVADSLRMAREASGPLREVHLSQAGRLSRAFAALVEALDRHRGKGHQVIRIERVDIASGAQAVVGMVRQGDAA